MGKGLRENIQELIDKGMLSVRKDEQGNLYSLIRGKADNTTGYLLYDSDFRTPFRRLYNNQFSEMLSMQEVQNAVELIEVMGADDVDEIETCKRIFYNGYQYAYELDRDNGTCIWIEDGEICITQTEGIIFRHSANYASQVKPNLGSEPEKLLSLMKKHFSLKSESDVKLLTLYLVTAFWGLGISHPILVFTGEKGATKSSSFRKLERLIDPKTSDLVGGIPKGSDGLALRLYNSYFVALDNLSSLKRGISDILAAAVTGSAVTKRALYKNSSEIVMDIKAVIAINGVSLVARESDLLDRSLIITLDRIPPDKILTEEEVWNAFEKDRADILGCCFNILASALNDAEEIEIKNKIRMADFHVACIKAGRVLGWSEEEVSALLWANQKNVNKCTLDEDVVALCVIELMQKRKEYRNS
ncbi:MAG: hypothetical protein NC489_45735, partial [Ruminococcus flavefaciens]|nr:hypothetical protein [Ruminococcus flavefaciens]